MLLKFHIQTNVPTFLGRFNYDVIKWKRFPHYWSFAGLLRREYTEVASDLDAVIVMWRHCKKRLLY